MKPRVLLAEMDVARGREMARVFSRRFECRHVSEMDGVVDLLRHGPWSAVVASYRLGVAGSGVEVLQIVREALPRTFRLIYSEAHSPSFLRDAQRIVQSHFTTAVVEPDFIPGLERALWALLEPPSLEIPADLPAVFEDVWTARSPLAREFLRDLQVAAQQDTPVYVYGEPGTMVTRSGVTLRQWRREWRAKGSPAAPGADNQVPILRVPSLRERPQDLPLLAARCLVEHARHSGAPLSGLSPGAIEVLLERNWFGNIVELAGVLLRAQHRAASRRVIEADDLPKDARPAWRPSQYAKDEGQRDCVLRQLRSARNVSSASRLEGCSRANYIRLMRRLGIIRADVVVGPEQDRVDPLSM